MLLRWLGVFFLSSLCVFLYPVYGVDATRLWMLFLCCGLLSSFIASFTSKSDTTYSRDNKLLLALIPIALGILAFRFPYNLSLYVIAAGIFISFLPGGRIMRALSSSLLASGLMLGFQALAVPPYFKFAARFHEANVCTPFFYQLFKSLGVSCAYSQSTLFVRTPQDVLSLVTTGEKLGLFFFLVFICGSLVVLFNASDNTARLQKWKNAGILALTITLYSIIRYVVLCLIFVDSGKAPIFWEPLTVAGSFLPLPFLVWRILSLQPARDFIPTLSFSREKASAGIAACVFSLAAAGFFCFNDPGVIKKGKVLFDEYYSDWEWTQKKLDTKWFGIQSVYNYYCFADFVNHFYSTETLKATVTAERLSQCDVFIVKTPTRSFSENEIATIVNFVKNGGGLFLIGDHTNVFGTTMNINPLAERFGLRFNYDSTYDLINLDLHFHEHNTLFRHPVIQNMPYFLFATSCSLDAPLSAEDVLIASNLRTLYLDYSRGGFFPDKEKEKNYTFGLFLQSVGVTYGKGRVLTFADSTCFSNFYMYIPGKPEYTLGSINWLNRINRYDVPVKAFCLLVMLLAAVSSIYLRIKSREANKNIAAVLLLGALLGLSSGTLVCNFLAKKAYALPDEHTPMKKVAFETEHCSFQIPDRKLLHNPAFDYHTFYVWTQRLGFRPMLFSLSDPHADYEMLVFVNPVKNFSPEEIRRLESYVEQGGRVLVIDNPKSKNSTAHQILAPFNIRIRYDQYQENAGLYEGTQIAGTIASYAPVEGGEPLLISDSQKVFCTKATRGSGMLAAVACSSSLTNEKMGETETVPNEQQQFLYKLEFWLLSGLMHKKYGPFTDF